MSKMTTEELEGHIRFLKNDPATIQMVGSSKFAKAVDVDPNDTETIQMLIHGLLLKLERIGMLDDL